MAIISRTTSDTELGTKQPTLVSGTNIKTINSTTLLGSGDIAVQSLTNGLTEIGADLVDADKIPVYDASATANRKSLLSRIWTYISGKLTATANVLIKCSRRIRRLASPTIPGLF